ncbi:MAG: insulinase family protein [Gammaproteobacteria bacterium]|nr:insulinase family protein [Gammaproteobacteria bacterium]
MLESGLKLLVKTDHRAPVVVSQVWYKVGSSYEHDGITGISHALEHMMFKGTEKHPGGDFSRIISANGGQENAFTGADYTAYFQTLEKSRLAISFELEADRMRNLSLPADEFTREIEVVKEERRWRTEDDPQSYTYEIMMATAFQTSPYRNPIIGWESDLEKMTIEELRDWYSRWYAPGNATVVVVGDVEANAVYELAKKYFAHLPNGETPALANRQEADQLGIKRIKVKRPAELPYLLMAYKVPAFRTAVNNPDKIPEWEPYALEVVAGILDGGDSARFSKNLIRGREIASAISVSYDLSSRLDDVFVISSVPSHDHSIEQLEQAVRDEIEDLKTNRISAEELERVKAQVVANDIFERDSAFYQGMIIGVLETVGLSWRHADEYVDRVKAITAEQVQAVVKKYLVDDGLTVAELDPQPLDKSAQRPVSGELNHVR